MCCGGRDIESEDVPWGEPDRADKRTPYESKGVGAWRGAHGVAKFRPGPLGGPPLPPISHVIGEITIYGSFEPFMDQNLPNSGGPYPYKSRNHL